MKNPIKIIFDSKTVLIRLVAVLIIFILTLALERNLNTLQIDQSKNFITLYSGEISSLKVSYTSNEEYMDFAPGVSNFPRYISAQNPLTVSFFEDTYISMDAKAKLKTIKFQKQRLHVELLEGTIIFDNRISQQPVTVQVGQLFLQPFRRGRYLLKNTSEETYITALTGSGLVGVYDESGKLLQKKLLPKQSKISLSQQGEFSPLIENDPTAAKIASSLQGIDIDKEVNKATIFGVLSKGNLIDPIENKFESNILESVTINKHKKYLYDIYPYLHNLRQAEDALMVGNTNAAGSFLDSAKNNYISIVAGDADLILKANQTTDDQLRYLYGVHLEDSLYPIKKFHIETLKPKKSDAILSLLEDLDQAYARKETLELESQINLIKSLVSDNKDGNSIYYIEILDSMSSKYLIANNSSHIELRNKIGKNITNKVDQIGYKTSSVALMKKLQQLNNDKDLPTSELKKSATILLGNLDEADQIKFQNFVAELSAAE